jgi:hypothetical protein
MAEVVVVVDDVARGWRFALVLREPMLYSGRGVKAASRIWLEKVGGVMTMRVESDEVMVSVVWKHD